MRLVFISSVTAMMPLRTISVTTGSILDFFVLFFAAMLSAPPSCQPNTLRSPPVSPADRDHEIAERIHDERIARHQHGGRRVLLDERRPGDAVAGAQLRTLISGRRHETAGAKAYRPFPRER